MARDIEFLEQDPRTGRFLPGNSGFGGRPKGSRNQLTSLFWNDLYDVWKRRGKAVIEELANDDPAALARIVAASIVKHEEATANTEARDAVVEKFIEERRQEALKMIAKMDAQP